MTLIRSRWAAVGAAVAIAVGAGGVGLVGADVTSGERTVFVPVTPCRIIDTRPEFQVGPRGTPLGTAETHDVSAHGTTGQCTIPTDAVGLALNVTALDATLPTFLTIWATGAAMPLASSLNPSPGQPPVPNAVVVELSPGGQFSIYNLQGTVHVLADVNGYYAHHTHDDRYYTKTEVDDAISAIPAGPRGPEGPAGPPGPPVSLEAVTAPAIIFAPSEWTITGAGPGVETISMVADVSPLTPGEVQAIDGRLVWEQVEIDLCEGEAFSGDGVGIRGQGDGFLTIGDVFETNSQKPGCPINDSMQAAIDAHGPPMTACLSVHATAGDVGTEYCAPLDVPAP